MTEPWEWEEGELLAFVAQKAEESLELDFKSCPALDISSPAAREKSKFGLSKDVSAFANSAGGTLVYGIIEDPKTHTAEKLDAGYDPGEVSQDWIGQVVNSSRIQPRIANVRIKPVQLNASNPGRVAYVVYVPQSSTAHQASDKRYYKRHNFESVPMEDYEVRDTMHRALAPHLSVRTVIEGSEAWEGKFQEIGEHKYESPPLEFYVANEPGAAVAEYAQIQIFSSDTIIVVAGPGVASETRAFLPGGHWKYHRRSHVISPDAPLFADEHRLVDGFAIRVARHQNELPMPLIIWRTRANNTGPSYGAVIFTQIVEGYWKIETVSLDQLPDGYSAEFAP